MNTNIDADNRKLFELYWLQFIFISIITSFAIGFLITLNGTSSWLYSILSLCLLYREGFTYIFVLSVIYTFLRYQQFKLHSVLKVSLYLFALYIGISIGLLLCSWLFSTPIPSLGIRQPFSYDPLLCLVCIVPLFITFAIFYFYMPNKQLGKKHDKKSEGIPGNWVDCDQKPAYTNSTKPSSLESITKYINNMYLPDTHLSLAIEAPWGSGKSTLLNMLVKELGNPIRIELSILLTDTPEILIQRFYDKLYIEFEKVGLNKDNVLPHYVESVLKVMSAGAYNLPNTLSHSQGTYFEKAKEKLDDQIRSLLHTYKHGIQDYILVTIDDIDRSCMTHESVRQAFVLIDEFISLKNCVSIYSFSQTEIIRNERDFLEKYIDRTFHLYDLGVNVKEFKEYFQSLYLPLKNINSNNTIAVQALLFTLIINYYDEFKNNILDEINSALPLIDSMLENSLPHNSVQFNVIKKSLDHVARNAPYFHMNYRSCKIFMREIRFLLDDKIFYAQDNLKDLEESKLNELKTTAYGLFKILTICLLFGYEYLLFFDNTINILDIPVPTKINEERDVIVFLFLNYSFDSVQSFQKCYMDIMNKRI